MRRPPALNLAEYDLNKVLAETIDLIQHEARNRTNIKIVTCIGDRGADGTDRSGSDETSVLEFSHECF